MVNRSAIAAADDAAGEEGQGGQQDAPLIGGLTAEESAEFAQMAQDSPRGEVVREGDADGAADAADAAAAAAKAPDNAAAADKGGEKDAQAADDDADDGEPDPTQGGKFPQRVNYQRFRRETERRKAVEAENFKLKDRFARIDERMKILNEAAKLDATQGKDVQKDPNDLGPMPDPEEDIFATAKWQAKKIEQLEGSINGVASARTADTEEASLRNSYQQDVRTFAAENADFLGQGGAYEYLMASRVAELAMSMYRVNLYQEGAQLPKEQLDRIAKVIEAEEKQIATAALKEGWSPSEVIYGMAQARGYRKAAPADGGAAQQQNGKAPVGGKAPAQQGAPGKPSVSAAIAAVKRGVDNNKSLSSGGGAPETELTGQALDAMDDDQFAAFLQTASPEQMRAVLGD